MLVNKRLALRDKNASVVIPQKRLVIKTHKIIF